MATDGTFRYEYEFSEVPESEVLDSRGNKVTTIKCHGRLVAGTADRVREIFEVIPFHGRIIIDLSDIDSVDSAGLGALIRLKLSAVKERGVSVKYVQIAPRLMHLLNIANLTQWFSSETKPS
ncbi:MAG: STAS domain-containing protein [Acidobacteriaceae bacterium]|nr:STAS domain-containing protein [Acidobacteriaceae bacterium]MBV8571004.1 STAS domain-containing protein [Acidobacteriaceae bacterium]